MKELISIQSELKVPKTNYNAFAKFKYRSAEDILEAVKPLLYKYGSKLTMSDDVVLVGNKLFIKSTAKFSNGEDEEIVNGFAEMSEHKGMSSEQATGTASSYARKYALNGLFLIDETEQDADSKNNTSYLSEWKEVLANCKTLEDLQVLYEQNNPTDQNIKALFTKRKLELK